MAIVADGHHGGLRRCPRLTAGVHLAIVQLLVCCAAARPACRLPDSACRSGRAVAGAAGGVQGGGFPPWECVLPPLCSPPDRMVGSASATCACDLIERAHGPLSPTCMSMCKCAMYKSKNILECGCDPNYIKLNPQSGARLVFGLALTFSFYLENTEFSCWACVHVCVYSYSERNRSGSCSGSWTHRGRSIKP